MFVPSFLVLWWPKIDRKSGFPQLFAKTVGSIHFIPGIYTYGVSLWTPIDFRVRALIFGPLVAKNWPKIGVSATFRENCRLDSFHPWDLYLWGKSLDPYDFRVHALIFGPLVAKNWPKIGVSATFRIRAGVYCPHLWAQLVLFCFALLQCFLCLTVSSVFRGSCVMHLPINFRVTVLVLTPWESYTPMPMKSSWRIWTKSALNHDILYELMWNAFDQTLEGGSWSAPMVPAHMSLHWIQVEE